MARSEPEHLARTVESRHWGFRNAVLLDAVGDGPINGQPAERVLHVMRRFEEAQARSINDELHQFIAALAPGGEAAPSRRGLVLGEINEITASKYGHAITLRQSRRRYYIDNRLLDKIVTSYRSAHAAIGNKQARVVALMLLELKKGYARVVDMCLMLCHLPAVRLLVRGCDRKQTDASAARLKSHCRQMPTTSSPTSF
ncbi:DUF1173 family protein [Paraburkholderia aromaticivorans]|uniref:DUF1173 family protein n=1 Tax=Paraburkholderia aromaticivorans TaxID=2026199 RepID=UPI001455FE29|nr:DUF1173 family protein [Paraburkholderia aromaticivorans]